MLVKQRYQSKLKWVWFGQGLHKAFFMLGAAIKALWWTLNKKQDKKMALKISSIL